MEGIIQIVKALEDSGFLLNVVSETIQNEAKEKKGGFLSLLLSTLGASLLGNILTSKGMNRAGERLSNNTKVQKYYQNEPSFNGVLY